MQLHLTGPAEETAVNGVDGRKRDPDRLVRRKVRLIQPLLQDCLDRFISGIIKVQRPRTGVLQTQRTVLLSETDDALGGAQIVQNPVAEERLNQSVTVGTDRLGLALTRLSWKGRVIALSQQTKNRKNKLSKSRKTTLERR